MTTGNERPPEEPGVPRGGRVSNVEFAGCLISYALIAIVILGLPVAVIVGIVTGEWRLLIPWLIIVVIVFVLGRLNLIPIIGD